MILYIDTTKNNDNIELKAVSGEEVLVRKKIKAKRAQSEKLLAGIKDMLEKNNLELSKIKGIKINNKGGSFTSLRIGVATANALGFALGVPVESFEGESKSLGKNISIVEPEYSGQPNITKKKE